MLAGRARTHVSFFVSLIGVAAFAALYLLGPMRAYANLPIVFLSNFAWWQYALLALGTAGGIVALVAGAAPAGAGICRGERAPLVLAVAVLVAAIYALFLRQPVGTLADYDAYALRTFANFYLTVPGLLAALVGFALLARAAASGATPALFTTVALFSFFFFYKIRIAPDHFWMARRFLPVILPGALLFAAAAALSGGRGQWASTRLVRGAIGVSFLALLGYAVSRGRHSPSWRTSSTRASSRGSKRSHRAIGDRDLLIVESRNASDTHLLGLPLAYIYAKTSCSSVPRKPDKTISLDFSTGRARVTNASCSSAEAAPTCCRRRGTHRR